MIVTQPIKAGLEFKGQLFPSLLGLTMRQHIGHGAPKTRQQHHGPSKKECQQLRHQRL